MRTFLSSLTVLGLLASATPAIALDYSASASQYADAGQFSVAERAAISVLTELGVVGGNPDGNFAPMRPLNRAEFLKITLLLNASAADIEALSPAQRRCFPDVPEYAWYAPYVCFARNAGIIGGYPDGTFRPEQPVIYAEALKMLAEGFHYVIRSLPGDAWYAPYARAVQAAGTGLPASVSVDRPLTRGQMARLAAAFAAEAQGELAVYRRAERGQFGSSSSSTSSSASTSSSSSSSSSSSTSSSSSSSSSSSVSNLPDLPVRSHFLVLGERTEPVAAITLFADKEAVFIRSIVLKLEQELPSLDAMFLVDENGVEIGPLTLDSIGDNTDRTWKGTFAIQGAYRIPKGEERVVGVELRLKERNAGGISGELVEVDDITITAQGEDSQSTYTSNSNAITFPRHQTAQGRVTSVTNALSSTDSLPVGSNQLIAAFTFTGMHVPQTELLLRDLQFQLSKSSTVTVSNLTIGTADSPDRWPCSMSDLIVSCSSIPSDIGSLTSGPRTLRLFANVALEAGASDFFLQVSLNQPGSPTEDGAIHWNDGTSTFTWTELNAPIARSTRFQ